MILQDRWQVVPHAWPVLYKTFFIILSINLRVYMTLVTHINIGNLSISAFIDKNHAINDCRHFPGALTGLPLT